MTGGLIGAWEAAVLILGDKELTTSRGGAAALALVAFAVGAAVTAAAGAVFCLLLRASWGKKLWGRRVAGFTFALVAGAFFYAAFYLNGEVLPGKTQPLSLAADLGLLVGAWLLIRFLPRLGLRQWAARVVYAALALGAFAVALIGAGGTRRLGPPTAVPRAGSLNLLLITMDTTRADRFRNWARDDTDIASNLDRLARDSLRPFGYVYCPLPLTGPSHATVLTGRAPRELGVVQNGVPLPENADTLAEVLRRRGYRTGAVVGAFPVSSKLGFAQGFEFFDDDFSPWAALSRLTIARVAGAVGAVNTKAELQRRAGEVTKRAVRWLGDGRNRPFFLWVHYYDPHMPYDPPSPYRLVSKAADPQTRLYDGEVAYMDAEIGVLLDYLKRAGLHKNTAIVAVADHGESLGEHDYYYDHGRDVYEPCMRVPLIISAPAEFPGLGFYYPTTELNIEPYPFTFIPTQNLYLFLTEGLAAYPARERVVDGKLVSLGKDAVFGETHDNGRNLLMVVTRVPDKRYMRGTKKLIYDPHTGKSELYDLDHDPGERTNAAAAEAETTRALRDTLLKHFAAQPPLPPPPALDAKTKEKLRSLGYM